jgi:hypothetical protein
MCSGVSSVPRISSGSRLKLKSKKDESRDCNQDQKKGMRRGDYSLMVRFFDGRLFSSCGFSPCPPWPWGFFCRKRRSEMMEVCMSGFAEHRRAILLAMEMHREW